MSFSYFLEYNGIHSTTKILVKQTKVEELLTCIKKLKKYPHRILYYGNKNKEELSRLIKTYHDVPNNFIEVKNDIKYYKEKDHDKKYVFWTPLESKRFTKK